MNIVIVEGPAGAGKTTYIKKCIEKDPRSTFVSSSLEDYTGSRLPTENIGTLGLAMMNDVRKYTAAVDLLYGKTSGQYDTVYIDRLVYSQFVYGAIRLKRRILGNEIRQIAENSWYALNDLKGFINKTYQWSNGDQQPVNPDVQVMFIVPSWDDLTMRRVGEFKATGKTYPGGKRDWEWYDNLRLRIEIYFEGTLSE